jgi:hypothetical protein
MALGIVWLADLGSGEPVGEERERFLSAEERLVGVGRDGGVVRFGRRRRDEQVGHE